MFIFIFIFITLLQKQARFGSALFLAFCLFRFPHTLLTSIFVFLSLASRFLARLAHLLLFIFRQRFHASSAGLVGRLESALFLAFFLEGFPHALLTSILVFLSLASNFAAQIAHLLLFIFRQCFPASSAGLPAAPATHSSLSFSILSFSILSFSILSFSSERAPLSFSILIEILI